MTLAASFEALLSPADLARRWALRALGPWAAPWAKDRDARVAVLGALVIITAFLGTALVPLWMLALGPIALGVPHILADVRYLWVRPGFHRRAPVWLGAAPLLLAGGLSGHVYLGLLGCGAVLAVARTGALRRALGITVSLSLALAAFRAGPAADLLFAHLHNLMAIALFVAMPSLSRRRPLHPRALFVVLFAIASIAILLGAIDPVVRWKGPGQLRWHLQALAPFAGAALGGRLVLLFAFAQSVHYGIWLRLVPEEDRPRPAPRSFRSSARALLADFGPIPIALTLAGSLALAAWASIDLAAARAGYLRFAVFHGHLELVAGALLWAERRREGASC